MGQVRPDKQVSMLFAVIVCVLPLVWGALVQNGDMESMSGWNCWGFKCELTNDHHTGHHGIKATGRTQWYQGPLQDVKGLKANEAYRAEGWVKLLNDHPNDIGQMIELEVAITFQDNSKTYISVAVNPLTKSSDGWVHLLGDFIVPANFKSASLYCQGPTAGINFVIDSVSLTPIADNTHWRAESDSVIDRVRKNFINFHINIPHGISSSQVQIETLQTKKSFPFGTAVSCQSYLTGDHRYQDFINKHFNWAVTENALKWSTMEKQRGHINYDLPLNCVKKLRSNGLKVRAHNAVWSVDSTIQDWVKALRGQALKDAVKHRIQDIVGRTKNLVEQWDVNNENLHGFFYQRTLNDVNYNLEIFRIAHRADPNVKLFLNEYDVVASGAMTEAYHDQIIEFKNAHVGLGGVGVQCHFPKNVYPDPTLIKQHLDVIAKAGLPIWVTELDVINSDEHTRADWYETALRAFYGHPAVEGIMFWGFWSRHHWRGEPSSLVSGDTFRINAAGQKFLDLTEKKWMTHETHKISESGKEFQIRAFHGDYTVRVLVDGKEVSSLTEHFTLGKSDHTLHINVHH